MNFSSNLKTGLCMQMIVFIKEMKVFYDSTEQDWYAVPF